MFVIAGTFQCKPEHKEALIALAQSLIAPSQQEEGCISYRFFEDKIRENNFLFFEEWTSRAAIDEHFEKPYFKAFMVKFPPMIVGAATIKIHEVAGTEIL